MAEKLTNLAAIRATEQFASRATATGTQTLKTRTEELDTARAAAEAALAQGTERVQALKAQGYEVVQDINSKFGRYSDEYIGSLRADFFNWEEQIERYTGLNAAVINNVKKWREDAEGSAAELLAEFSGEAEDYRQQLEEISAQIEEIEGTARAEIEALASALREDFEEIRETVEAELVNWAQENLKPIADWVTENIVTPIFGEGEGILNEFKKIAAMVAPMIEKLSVAVVYFKMMVSLLNALNQMRRAANAKFVPKNDHVYIDFSYQKGRWIALMEATKGSTGVKGHRLPPYERIFRFRRFQSSYFVGGSGQFIGQPGSLKPLKGETGDGKRYPSTMLWYALASVQQDQIAKIFIRMGWASHVPTDDNENVRDDLSNLYRGERAEFTDGSELSPRDFAFRRWPSQEWTYRVLTSKHFNHYQRTDDGPTGHNIVWSPEGWPIFERGQVGERDNLPDRSPRHRYVYRWGGLGIPEIPYTLTYQIPPVYLAFWLAPNDFDNKRLLKVYEEVAWEMRSVYAHGGYKPMFPGTGDVLAPRGRSWMELRQIDYIPMLLDTRWVQANLILPGTGGGPVGGAPNSTIAAIVGMSDDGTGDPRQSLTGQSYGKMMKFISDNRGPQGLVEIRKVEFQKNPGMQAAIEWSRAIMAGSPEAMEKASALAAKAADGTATDDELTYLTQLQTAMYGMSPRGTVEGR